MMPDPSVILRVVSLEKAYRRRPVLRGVDLEAHPGEAIAIIGPNGAGKSTFLGCLSGERLPDGGTIRICGVDPFQDPASAAQCMGFVPEQPHMYDELTVGEILGFVIRARAIATDEGAREAGRLLGLFGLEGTESVPCRELSQGMSRKVAIILALLHDPRLIVLDEVFNGLDQDSSTRLLEELDRRRAKGAAVLLSSHDLGLLGVWCDRGLLLAREGWHPLAGEDWAGWREEQSGLLASRVRKPAEGGTEVH